MRVRILFPLILGLSLQWLSGKGILPLREQSFFLVIHSESAESSWTENLETQFRKHGVHHSGRLESETWLFQKPTSLRSYATLSIPAETSKEAGIDRIQKAVSLLKRKFSGSGLRLVLISEPRLKKIAQFYLSRLKDSGNLLGNPIKLLGLAKALDGFESRPQKVDDWVYESEKSMPRQRHHRVYKKNTLGSAPTSYSARIFKKRVSTRMPMVSSFKASAMMESDSLGLSVGGAKDIGNFRENINQGYLPRPSDLTPEGLYYDYFFDPGPEQKCVDLFCPSYAKAVSPDPFSMNEEYYLSVGLRSGLKASEFRRKNLNLVVVLDISGSMGSRFNDYHYDRNARPTQLEESHCDGEPDRARTKLEIATRTLTYLLDHLKSDDRFALVLFDDQAQLAKPFRRVDETNMDAIKAHILSLRPRGGTHLSAGMEMGTQLFENLESDPTRDENRIIFLTDAMPNRGEIGSKGLLGRVQTNANRFIHSTLIGIGVDFQTELVEKITKVRGANYYSVHSAKQFKKRLADEFEYMVSPLIFNLKLSVVSTGYEIEKIYGVPEVDGSSEEILKIHTLFPSKQESGQVKGGLILLKLKPKQGKAKIKLMVSYEDIRGKSQRNSVEIHFSKHTKSFDNNGIRKGVLLAKYADLMRHWILDERSAQAHKPTDYRRTPKEIGMFPPRPVEDYNLGIWEQRSMELKVSNFYKGLFKDFARFFEKEALILKDRSLEKELKILRTLSSFST
jgi:Ca-activated chloride channel homolog